MHIQTSSTLLFLILLSACAATTPHASTTEQVFAPVVTCEFAGQHGVDSDRIAGDAALATAAILDLYPDLPPALQKVTARVPFVIDHDDTIGTGKRVVKLTKEYMGWSAEDDLTYRYPDRKFAPAGTIKVNLTEQFVQLAALCASGLLPEGDASLGCREQVREILAHEILHAYQYHTDPVRDLATTPGACQDGLCDPEVIGDTQRKVEYERQAWVFGSNYRTARAFAAYSEALARLAKAQPALFSPGGRYSLMGAAHSPDTMSLQEAADRIGFLDFPPGTKEFYEGQAVMPHLAFQLNALLKETSAGRVPAANARTSLKTLESAWFQAVRVTDATRALLTSYPHLVAVAHRFEADDAAMRQLLLRLESDR